MKKEFDGEKLAIIIVIIIILAVIGYVVYEAFVSNKNLSNNQYEEKNLNNNGENQTPIDNSSTNQGGITDEQKDQMNVDEDKIPDTPVHSKEEQIATYTTTIYDKDQNRVDNITLANSKLNEVIVKKGETFSFNDTIGPMNEAQGFKKALGFDAKGNKIQISGGGLCQISSTLYNAVLMANMEVTERHAHSRRVYYVPKDKDATIAYGTLDFKFFNNTENDIKIKASNDNVNVTITLFKLT